VSSGISFEVIVFVPWTIGLCKGLFFCAASSAKAFPAASFSQFAEAPCVTISFLYAGHPPAPVFPFITSSRRTLPSPLTLGSVPSLLRFFSEPSTAFLHLSRGYFSYGPI
jgi:hypothetical protein